MEHTVVKRRREPLELALKLRDVTRCSQEPGKDFGEAIALPDNVGSVFHE